MPIFIEECLYFMLMLRKIYMFTWSRWRPKSLSHYTNFFPTDLVMWMFLFFVCYPASLTALFHMQYCPGTVNQTKPRFTDTMLKMQDYVLLSKYYQNISPSKKVRNIFFLMQDCSHITFYHWMNIQKSWPVPKD